MVADQEQSRAQALHLQRPAQLYVDALPDAAGRQDHEGREDSRDDGQREPQTDERFPPAGAFPHERDTKWHQHRRIELRGDGEP